MCKSIRVEWSYIVDKEMSDFPFHDDFVVRIWVDYRKEKDKDKQAIRDSLHGAGKVVPKRNRNKGNLLFRK
jgi:hypothetical protein